MVQERSVEGNASLTTAETKEATAELSDNHDGVERTEAVARMPLWKRAMDVCLACVALVLLSPLLLAVALWIKLVSRGPIFFKQARAGLHGKSFTIWKFRTLKITADSKRHQNYVKELAQSDGKLKKMNHGADLIPLGRVLRALGIDELPQLVNVLKGEMSIVGPRPDVIPFDVYTPKDRKRFDVLPGITGLWQVSGKNATTFDEMIRLDIEYVRGRSLLLDLKILLLTLPAILSQVKENLF